MGLASRVAVFAVLVAACGDNIEPKEDVDTSIVIALDTIAPAQVTAGETIAITCTLIENDIPTIVPADVRVVAEDYVMRMGNAVMARTAGMVEVSCALPERGLVDPTPALVEIVHGVAANVVTTLTPDPVIAGNEVTATCVVYDAYGNVIEDGEEPVLEVSPIDAGNTLNGLSATMTRAGHYIGRCSLAGTSTNNAGFDVIPNLPASIVLARWPDLPVYAVGAIVDVTHIVSDRYGNEILDPAVTRTTVATVGTGPFTNVLAGQWRFDGEGRYTVTHTVDPPTDGDVTLSANVVIVVNSRGPAISCVNDASMQNLTPGATYTVSGNANDVNGVASLTVNGSSVAVAQDGSWSANITTRFGLNFVNITATDEFDQPTTKVCTFLISNRYGLLTSAISDTVSLKLTQPAVDDNNRNDGLDSLDDLLYAIINSSGLSNTLHNTLLAANPIKPYSCHQNVCVPLVGCACVLSSTVNYRNRDLPGPNTVSLDLVTNGLEAYVYIPNPGINLRLNGRVAGVGYDTTGWVRFSYVSVGLILDTAIVNGRPRISVRPGSVTANVGTVTTDFSGLDGWLIDNILVPLANGYIRDAVRNIIRDFITNNFNAALDGVVSSLDISTLGTTFNVPRITGSGSVPMGFGLSFSSLATSSSRMLFGIGTRFTTTAANAYPSLGVPLPPTPNVLGDPSVFFPQNTAVAAHVGVLNGALHALWRANYFSGALSGTTIPGLPAGVSFVINTRLPPVTYIAGAIPQMHLGALDLTVTHPSLPPDLSVTIGAEAHATVNLSGNDLIFGGIVIDELHVSTDAVNLTPQQQNDLESVLLTLLQTLINDSLNDVLPAIPIPSFTLPSTLSQFGLPAGAKLGLVSPTLTVTPQHFTLRGAFGVQ